MFQIISKIKINFWKLFFIVLFIIGIFTLITWDFSNNKANKPIAQKYLISENAASADPDNPEEYPEEEIIPVAPTASPSPGPISTAIKVTFSTTTEDATICRGLPFGNEPGTSDESIGTSCFAWNYSGIFEVYPGDVYKLIAVKDGVSSSVYTASYPKITESDKDLDAEDEADESAKALNLQAEEYMNTLNSGSKDSAKALNSRVDEILKDKDVKSLDSEEKVKDLLEDLAN